MNSGQPFVSVLTPSWNRAEYLERVWKGLDSQTFRDFEWLVANDGSSDDTRQVVQRLARASRFPVILIDADTHIGKPRMDNELLKNARGEFVIWNDSDDYLVPHALSRFLEVWNSIPLEQVPEYVGLTSLCCTADGAVQSTNTPSDEVMDTTWNELINRFDVHGDKTFFIRHEVVRNHRFVEVDFMITESSFWKSFSDMKTKFIPEALKVVDRVAPHRISYSGKMEYCRGRAYGIALSDDTASAREGPLRKRLWKATTYFRYCLHGEVPLRRALSLWNGNLPAPVFLATYPFGWAFAVKDRIQRKVLRTHRAFDAAMNQVKIEVTSFQADERA